MSSYLSKKIKHAYKCYKKGISRQKVYAVVEKGDKYVVLKNRPNSKYLYNIAGGTIEKKEDVVTAAKREILEELNMVVEYVSSIGTITTQSQWNYKGKDFIVNDEMHIVYTRFVEYGNNKMIGLKGEFDNQDIVLEISKEEMLHNVYEFVEGSLTFN